MRYVVSGVPRRNSRTRMPSRSSSTMSTSGAFDESAQGPSQRASVNRAMTILQPSCGAHCHTNMTAQLRQLDLLAMWRRPAGQIDRWVKVTIVIACIVTLAVAAAGARALWFAEHHEPDTSNFWF